MKHLHTFERFLSESEAAIKADKLIGIMNDANKEGSTILVIKGGKTYELTSVLYVHFKTIEFKALNGPNVIFKHSDMITVKVNESYKRPSPTTKIAGVYSVSWGRYPSLHAMIRIAGFERENDDSDSLYLMDDDRHKSLIGSLIVKNKDMSKLEKGIEVKAKTSIGDQEAIIRRVSDL